MHEQTPWRITTLIVMVVVMTLFFLALPKPAGAQVPNCGPREIIVERLTSEKFKEQQAGLGQMSASIILELWRNPDTGTWTVITTHANGMSCLRASGDAWQERIILPGEPS